MHLFRYVRVAAITAACAFSMSTSTKATAEVTEADVPVFITLGQSNADGSAFFNSTLDAELEQWYSSAENPHLMKIWYRSTKVENQTSNSLNEAARWVVDGTVTDAEPGWLDLWYRNENTQGRTAMNMIHSFGTYSTGSGTDCAQGRRGMEGAFGRAFQTALPSSELYILKLGVSGSFISSWANPADDHNWEYFYENIFKPAMTDLLSKGKRPRLAGVWWMQGCADNAATQEYYQGCLLRLVNRIHKDLGFADGKIYVGHIVKPGESEVTPTGSTQFGQNVRNAQDAVAAAIETVEIIDTKNISMQYEANFSGYLHFDHAGVNAIGQQLAKKVIDAGNDGWAEFSTPGTWTRSGNTAVFTPAFGEPTITYSTEGNTVSATITYPGFQETKTYNLDSEENYLGPGYLDCDGTRYMSIPQSDDFTVPVGGALTITFNMNIPEWAPNNSWYGLICNNFRNTSGVRSGFDIFMGSGPAYTLANNLVPDSGSRTQATNFGGPFITSGYTPGNWAHVAWTYNGVTGESKIYINGVALRETTGTQTYYPLTSFCDILVGARWLLNDNPTTEIQNILNGKISDLRFYKAALTADEVAADAEAVVADKELIAAYDFRQITGLTVKDITGNGHDATLINFPEFVAGSPLTIEQPTGGSIAVYNAESTQIVSGQNVEDGTTLTVMATPEANYTLKAIKVNGETIEGNTFVMNGATTVSAEFERDKNAPSKVLVFGMYEDNSKFYRIPALCCTKQGTLIAVADKRGSDLSDLPNTISVVMKRSTDNGDTWSDAVTLAQGNTSEGKTYGDPAIVCDRETGTIICVFVGDTGFFTSPYGTKRPGLYYVKSTDDGITWTDPVAFTDQVYQNDWYAAFCASGAGFQDAQGRIMFVANARTSSNTSSTASVYEFLVYTDDLGETWHVANPNGRVPEGGYGNESKVVELSNGDLLMSMRYGTQRRFMTSTDRGATWGKPYDVPQLIEPTAGSGCNGDIVVYPSTDGQKRMLHTSAASYKERRDVSVFLSYDEGRTWPISKKLIDGRSAYSALTVLNDGTIGCFVEDGWGQIGNMSNTDGFNLYFMRFTLDWLTDGSDVDDTSEKAPEYLDGDGTRYMYIPNHEDFNIPAYGSMTISYRMYMDNMAPSGSWYGWVCNNYRNSSLNRSGFDLFSGSNSSQTLGLNASPDNNSSSDAKNFGGAFITSGYTPGEWAHVVWSYNGATGESKIYINGTPLRETTNALNNLPITSFADILVGCRYTCPPTTESAIARDNCFTGKIDDLRFYREALTAEEVAADYEGILEDKTLIAAYDFSKMTGTNVPDISGNNHDGVLVGFPDYATEGHVITIEAPDEIRGSLKVYNGDTEIFSGRKITEGTELTVVAEAVSPYVLDAIKVNDVALEEGVTTFIVEGPTVVSAEFVRDPDLPANYVEPNGDGASDSNCYVETASTTGATENINITRTGKNGSNYELCDDETIIVSPGQEFSLRLQAKVTSTSTSTAPKPQDLRYCVVYIFSDWDCDGTFEHETPSDSRFSSKDYYGYWKEDTGFPGATKCNYDYSLDLTHNFTVPENAAQGTSRIRVIYTEAWDQNVPNGRVDGNYQNINKGYSYDYLVQCVEPVAIDRIEADEDANAPVEYFNLQGMRVSGKLVPGVYIVRQGSKVRKVLVK